MSDSSDSAAKSGGVFELDLTEEEQPTAAFPSEGIRQKRESYRGRIAMSLLAILALVIVATFLLVAIERVEVSEIETLTSLMLTPIVGLVGAATGFYYGGGGDAAGDEVEQP